MIQDQKTSFQQQQIYRNQVDFALKETFFCTLQDFCDQTNASCLKRIRQTVSTYTSMYKISPNLEPHQQALPFSSTVLTNVKLSFVITGILDLTATASQITVQLTVGIPNLYKKSFSKSPTNIEFFPKLSAILCFRISSFLSFSWSSLSF